MKGAFTLLTFHPTLKNAFFKVYPVLGISFKAGNQARLKKPIN